MTADISFKIVGLLTEVQRDELGRAIAMVPGVEAADIDLDRGIAKIKGAAPASSIIAAAAAHGYQIDLI